MRYQLQRTMLALCISAQALTGCHVMTVEEDRAFRERRSASFDAASYLDENWETTFLPQLADMADPAAQLLPLALSNPDSTGETYGRRAGEGSAWTYVVSGEAVVEHVATQDPEGYIALSVTGTSGLSDIRLLTGPVIVNTTIRDSLPGIAFNDFNDQLAFAAVGNALNERAIAAANEGLGNIAVGDKVTFVGAFTAPTPGAAIEIMPVSIRKIGNGG
jgi:predicted lipoprotein